MLSNLINIKKKKKIKWNLRNDINNNDNYSDWMCYAIEWKLRALMRENE